MSPVVACDRCGGSGSLPDMQCCRGCGGGGKRWRRTMKIEQMTDIYGVACDVHTVRTFKNGRELGPGYDLSAPSTWFVYDREDADSKWHKHCGPYSTFEQAKQWCLDVREN